MITKRYKGTNGLPGCCTHSVCPPWMNQFLLHTGSTAGVRGDAEEARMAGRPCAWAAHARLGLWAACAAVHTGMPGCRTQSVCACSSLLSVSSVGICQLK